MAERESWKISFRETDTFRDRARAARQRQEPAEPDDADEDRCSRGDWCAGRTVTVENGVRIVTPAATSRAYCDGCQDHIRACLEELPRLYDDLHGEMYFSSTPKAGEVLTRSPFGPSVPFELAYDTVMRAMTETLCSWEIRVRCVDSLSDIPGEDQPQDDEADLGRSVDILTERVSILLALAPEPMIRFVAPWTVREEDQDAEILAGDRWTVKIAAEIGGRRAGEEVMDLHYVARRLLLETSPPMPLLPDFRCRVCEQKTLRQAAPPWHEDGTWYHSRCDGCGDEMTREEYDLNAKRWIAWEKAHHDRPVLAGLGAA